MKLSINSAFVRMKSNGTHVICKPRKIVGLLGLKNYIGWFEVPSNSVFDYNLKSYALVSVLTLVLHVTNYNRGFVNVSKRRRLKVFLPLFGLNNHYKTSVFLNYLKKRNSGSTEIFYESCLAIVNSNQTLAKAKLAE
jgi:hypothetical protein